jgi:hypothetical protein
MSRETVISSTVKILSKLPDDKLKEVAEFADQCLRRYEEEVLVAGIRAIVSDSDAFYFLKEEEDLYSIDDLKEKYL